MPPLVTPSPLELAEHHLVRAAYHTRDNPYLRSQAAAELPGPQRLFLEQVVAGEADITGWLDGTVGRSLIDDVEVGALPRDLQLVLRENTEQVGVESVHGFFRAPLFWWLVSYLWTIELGRALDPLLGESIIGYRLHPKFLEAPGASARMFSSTNNAYRRWRRSAAKMTAEHRL